MKIWSTAILSVLLFLFQATAIAQPVKLSKAERKQEQKNIDSLILLHSLPIRVEASRKDSLFRLDIQTLLRDSLKARMFESLNYEKANAIYTDFFEDLFGVNDKQKRLENMEKSKTDKQHYIREMELAKPVVQTLLVSPCSIVSDNCINIQRTNFPNPKKKKWEFKQEESESINQFVSRIIDSLTSQTVAK